MMKRLGLYKNFSKFLEIIFQAEAALALPPLL